MDVTAQDLFSSVPFGCYNDGDEKGKITWVAMWGYIKKIHFTNGCFGARIYQKCQLLRPKISNLMLKSKTCFLESFTDCGIKKTCSTVPPY